MKYAIDFRRKSLFAVSAVFLAASVYADERIIQQGANVAPNGDRLDVTSKCLRLNGRALVPIMGEMHYSRVPRDEWAKSLATMKEGGVSIVSTYVFWNHHEWNEGEWDFSGNRDLSAFLGEVKKAGLWAVVRIGPWAHGECREGGFPDWLVDKGFEWANGDAKKARQILRSRDARFLGETKKLFERVHLEVAPHFWKNGGPVIGVQLENESRGPWPYYQALKKLAVEAGFDVPMYTRTGWPRLNGPETTFGEMIPLYGDYAEGFWDRELKSMPSGYKSAFEMRPARTSSVIATEQLGAQKAEDAKGAERYPYFTCELGGGMASSYHRRLVMEPMDAFALAVVKLGSGSNLPGFYMYHGGSNPTEYGVNMAESQRGRFTNYNDLPVVSYEFLAPVSEFGEPQYAYWMIKALADFCRENAEELAVADPVFVSKHETRRGRFIFHNDYVRHIKPNGECWIGVEKDGKVERLLDGRALAVRRPPVVGCRRLSIADLTLLKPAGTPPPVAVGPNGVAMPPEESAWGAAAEYEVPFRSGDTMLEIAYDGDIARLYADGKLVQDDFWKGLPIRYALRRLPKGTKHIVLKVLPRGAGWENKVYIDRARAGSSADDIVRYEAVGELARDPAEKPVDAPKDMKLVLCMGQSNMAGRAKMSDADREVVPRAYKLDRDGRWVAAKAPYHFDKTVAAVGPVDEFVRRYLADHPGESIGVVPCAVGGSPFYSWDPPPKGERKGVNYAKALERAKIAQANGKFIAILWHQGETDAAKAKDETGLNESYPRDFARMMSELRRELGEGDIPVIAGEIGRWMRPDGDHAARINPGIGKIPSLLPKSAVVSSEGLANQDRHHFDREGQRILGGRYYDAFRASADEFRAPRLGVVCETPAQARPGVAKSRAWEQSLLTGNGAMGAMVPGELAHEEIFLSHARLFLPRVMKGRYFELGKYRDRARELALAGREKEIWDEVIQKASDESGYSFKRDPFMGAVSLVVDTPDLPNWSDAQGYRRMTDFERGECTVRTDDYERRIFASRTDGVIAMRVKDAKARPFTVKLETISNGRPSGDAAIQRIREKDGYMYYRVDFRKENGKNPFHGYEAVGLRKGDEVFVKIYLLPFGTDSMFETAKRELSAAADTGYARLLERHAPVMKELMERVTLDLPDRDLVRKFHAGRYNIISSTGPDGVLPNLQGLWSGSWSAPYNGSYTVDGNMPCAMSFWTRGNTPEFNESLYEWIMRYYEDFKEAAKKGYNARGIHIPGQVTTTGLETAYYRNVELMWWHGGAGWMTGYLWRWYEATQDMEVLKKVYPLLKDAADYICDCMEEMPDGTLGFAPGYSPENAPHGDFRSQGDVMNPDLPKGGYSTMNNPTMDISVAKQSIDYATKAAKILKRDEASVREWAQKRARLPKYAVSKDGFWAEWLIPGTPDNNSHRHVSHVYALYDEAPAEILTNAAFVAAIKKTLDARMTFHERENHMAFGVTQIGYAAAKVGDAAVMERAIKLLQETYFTDALGTLHDPGWLFNIDISGGFPGIIADALITKGPDGGFKVLNAKPASWKKGSISGLLLPGGIKVKNLSWQGDSYELELLHPNGRITVQRK